MKDFAKSIYVGNAKDKNGTELKVGDVVAVKTSDPSLNHGKIVRISGDQISVDVTGDDDIWTTPARLAVKMGNAKVGNGLKEDMKRAYPNDSIVDDVKKSATYEAIVKQPWRVYDILGVGDSMIREYAFELIARKYGVDYDTIYYAWLHRGYLLSDYKSPSQEEKAKRDFQKLGVSVSNTKTGNADVVKDGSKWVVLYAEGTKSKEFDSKEAADKFAKEVGNKKIGNKDIHMSSSNSGELWLSDNGEGNMYDPIELGRYDFSGKSEALSVARELEQLKRKAEQKVKDADKFINAIKQWASGLK